MRFRRDFLAAMAGASPAAAVLPRSAPEIALTLPDGSPFRLAQLRGKIAAVSFISTG